MFNNVEAVMEAVNNGQIVDLTIHGQVIIVSHNADLEAVGFGPYEVSVIDSNNDDFDCEGEMDYSEVCAFLEKKFAATAANLRKF